MLIGLGELKGFDILATDGQVGKVKNLLFDDASWGARYLVVDTGWLFGRKVLLAPEAVEKADAVNGDIAMSLTKKEIEEAPGVATELPVSRQEELSLRNYYGWPRWWEVYPGGTGAAPIVPPVPPSSATASSAASEVESEIRDRGDPHLRSAEEVEGYHIGALDGEVGHVEDFVIDAEAWFVRYLVVDTRNWLPGRKVIVSPAWIDRIDWAEKQVEMQLHRETIKNAPAYDPDKRIAREYEKELHSYYRKAGYWE